MAVQAWSDGSLRMQQEHQQALQRLEAQKIAATLVDVPTLPHLVRDALRQLGLPVRLFGENLANVRDRLKWELAIRKQQRQIAGDDAEGTEGVGQTDARRRAGAENDEEEQVTKYTRASGALVEARQRIAEFSLQRVRDRLQLERSRRIRAALTNRTSGGDPETKKKRPFVNSDSDDKKIGGGSHDADEMDIGGGVDDDRLDQGARKTFRKVRNLALEGSQYCDQRAVSCLRVVRMARGEYAAKESVSSSSSLVVAGTWTGSIHVLDASLQKVGCVLQCHDDRIMAMDALPGHGDATMTDGFSSSFVVATASLDRTAKLFRIGYNVVGSNDTNATGDKDPATTERENATAEDAEMQDAADDSPSTDPPVTHRTAAEATKIVSKELMHLRGHAARLSRVAFHPMHQHVATTSYDHTWRLWDVETSDCLLLQDGHARECYGIGFHPDGSLVATTDLGGIVHLWDLRTSKSVAFYRSHAGKVLNAEFHPNGFHLGTAGEDGCVHVWDIRRRTKAQKKHGSGSQQQMLHGQATGTPLVSIPAHSGIVTGLRFDASGEFLGTSSFDGSVKLWNCRSWKLLNRLQGHQGKVTSVDVIRDSRRAGGSRRAGNDQDALLRGIVTSGFDKTVKLWV
jgi:WD40 repeat protein